MAVQDLVDRYVLPDRRYALLLHGNFVTMMSPEERRPFVASLREAAATATDDELTRLLGNGAGWRERITAAWLIGVDRRHAFRDRLAELLLESRLTYAGQGYCFALARFATPADAQHLAAYLDKYLRALDLQYDQEWAFGALRHVDQVAGTNHAAWFAQDDGWWERWATRHRAYETDHQARIRTLCEAVDAT